MPEIIHSHTKILLFIITRCKFMRVLNLHLPPKHMFLGHIKQCLNIVFNMFPIITSDFNVIIIGTVSSRRFKAKDDTNSEKFAFFILWLNDFFIDPRKSCIYTIIHFRPFIFVSFQRIFSFLKRDGDVFSASYGAIIREETYQSRLFLSNLSWITCYENVSFICLIFY